jgi:CRP-like cAMP-binding protein
MGRHVNMLHRDKFWYISTNKLFSGLNEKDKGEMLSHLKEAVVKKGSFVYSAGDRAETMYILKEGSIKISRFSEDGKELTLDMLKPGDIFGELVLAGEEERETIAQAQEDSFICTIKRTDFENLIGKNPSLSLTITKLMGLRLRRIENRLEEMIFKDVRMRILSTLNQMAGKYGLPVPEGIEIAVKLSHQDIANLIGSTRETVTLELNNLKRAGQVLIKKRSIIIPATHRS